MAPEVHESFSDPPPGLVTQDLGFLDSSALAANDAQSEQGGSSSNSSAAGSSSTSYNEGSSSSTSSSSAKISFSPPPSDSSAEQSDTEMLSATDSTADGTRKSSRARTSTLIYINGQAVKKENNYVVNGHEYVYGGASDDAPKKKQPKKASAPKQPPKPRAVTAQEAERRDKKAEIERTIRAKAPLRDAFLNENLSVLTPFVEPKVAAAIRERAATASAPAVSIDTVPMFMQPDGITGDMRSYQLSGLNWMAKMYSKNMSCILGDEMGLGKTLQTIALVCHLKEVHNKTGPSLIICPLSVLNSWKHEIERWAPSLKQLRFHSSNPESMNVPNLADYDMIVTTYEMSKNPSLRSLWSRQQFNLLVLDEGHRIKAQDTQISQAVRKIHSEMRLLLTGTPLANNLVELYSLLSFLAPDVFTTSQPFAEAFDLTLNHVDPVRLEQAHHLLKAFMIRRMKDEVEKLMPKKIETKVICPLSNMQIWWYKAVLLKDINLLTRASDQKVNSKFLSNLIMQLRKVCLHPFLFPDAEDIETTSMEDLIGASGKLAVLDKLLCALYEKGHRVVLFSQFTQVLDILEDYTNMRGWKSVRFDGGTARAKRNYVVNSFNAPNSDKFIFLMSTRAGGMGLNLQTADTCILYDSDWNPQPDIQAMARVHRLGQTKTVHVYRLVTQGTVEERMVERAEKKLYLDRMVNRDGATADSTSMEEEDSGKLLATLKFGCSAVFGQGSDKNHLPSHEDIAIITDRSRTEVFSSGNLKGGVDESADNFDATKKFTETMAFNGIDFKKIRAEHSNAKVAQDMGAIKDTWKKRQRKNRIMMVDGMGSGYGTKTVPVLAANDYDLQSGERSVFQQELRGRSNYAATAKKKKAGPTFEMQDFCQVCGDGGKLIGCPRCPISLHVECAGVGNHKHFMCCSHHHCAVCDKSGTTVGGFMYPCSSCPNSFCEDHLPKDARFLEPCERIEELGFNFKHGVYVHCTKHCEEVAVAEFGYKVPGIETRPPCPPALDLSSNFGSKVDESTDAPEEVIITGKRRRKVVNYAQSDGKPSPDRSNQASISMPADFFDDDREGKRSKENDEAWDPSATLPEESDDDDEIECLGTVPSSTATAGVAKKPPAVILDYYASLPVTKEGYLIQLLPNQDGSVCFGGYRSDSNGRPGPAQRECAFKSVGDRILSVNGQSCEGIPYNAVFSLLKGSMLTGRPRTILKMRPYIVGPFKK